MWWYLLKILPCWRLRKEDLKLAWATYWDSISKIDTAIGPRLDKHWSFYSNGRKWLEDKDRIWTTAENQGWGLGQICSEVFLSFFPQLWVCESVFSLYRQMHPLNWKHELIKMNLNKQDSLEKRRCVALLDAIIIFKCPERNTDV